MRQLADESNSVSRNDQGTPRQCYAPDSWIEGGKQLVGNIRIRPSPRTKQGRLAGVGITHERERRHRYLGPCLAAGLALLSDLLQTLGQDLHALTDQPAVGLELGLTRAAHADTARLPLEVSPAAHQARADVLQ